jgi:hypothetical protein
VRVTSPRGHRTSRRARCRKHAYAANASKPSSSAAFFTRTAFVTPAHASPTALNNYDNASRPSVAGDDPVNGVDPMGLYAPYCSPGDCPTKAGTSDPIEGSGAPPCTPLGGGIGPGQIRTVNVATGPATVPIEGTSPPPGLASSPSSDQTIKQLCVNLAVVQACVSTGGGGRYWSVGPGIGTPGVTVNVGQPQGQTAQGSQTGWSACIDGQLFAGASQCWSNASGGSTTSIEGGFPGPGGGVFINRGYPW